MRCVREWCMRTLPRDGGAHICHPRRLLSFFLSRPAFALVILVAGGPYSHGVIGPRFPIKIIRSGADSFSSGQHELISARPLCQSRQELHHNRRRQHARQCHQRMGRVSYTKRRKRVIYQPSKHRCSNYRTKMPLRNL